MGRVGQTQEQGRKVQILHLSDIHLGTVSEARKYRAHLATDLKRELGVDRLEYLIVSGDIASEATLDDYEAAFELTDGLMRLFGLESSRVIIVPGNHDLNWDLAAKAYTYVPWHRQRGPLTEGQEELYIRAGEAGVLLRDDELYKRRFVNFSAHYYRKVCGGKPYPLNYAEQAILHLHPDDCILILALNSCWHIDHYYRQRCSINMDALSHVIEELMSEEIEEQMKKCDYWLKIAVWHHPITGREPMNDEFLQLLAVHDFQVCIHGHIHEASEGFYKYDDARGIHIVGAGTFGAPAREQVVGIPLQYNLLVYSPETRTITIKTRKKEKPDGAWSADARWGDKNNPRPWYTIQLK